ncbi:hypothetical protein GALMADRAFT_145172 [Galerina marginata CBS 339.88]|uniref:Uncharacterized protein n=1 Tax=Galerina marginata (strain CBS 339.88) TaxID=685588 RepID=A0A067SFQ1_GALM3|nr:hypothetical protein GALMADRAFT_145172 [Galerina marginata CBS 339.88]
MAVVTLPPQSYLGWKVSMSILHILAIGSTIYRLIHRFRIQKTWLDDYIVFVPLVLDSIYWPIVCFRFSHVDPNNEPWSHRVLSSYWLSTFPFLLIVWATRIVLALSLARVFPKKHPARLCAFVLITFMSTGLLIVNEGQDCIKGVGGYPIKNTFLFAADFVGDILLVIAPIVFFWRLRLPSRERRLILMVFCGSILTLLLVIAFKIICSDDKISPGKDAVLIVAGLASIEAAISLFVCHNLKALWKPHGVLHWDAPVFLIDL